MFFPSQAYFGTWTFEEAFRRTARPVTIVISSNFPRKLPACAARLFRCELLEKRVRKKKHKNG
jgi:hypothetical protein